MRQKKKEDKKAKKQTDNHKKGKMSKRKGGRVERELKELLISWGYDTVKMPLSGGLKGKLSHDLVSTIAGKERRIESKAHESLVAYHNRYGQLIEGLCVILSQEQFRNLLLGEIPEVTRINKKMKTITDFFNQDSGTDLVVIKTKFKPFIFCLSLEFWEELTSG